MRIILNVEKRCIQVTHPFLLISGIFKSLTDSNLVYGIAAVWHKQLEWLCWMTLNTENTDLTQKTPNLKAKMKERTLTLAVARHMSATILPDTRVSKMFVVAKLKTFSKATCWNKTRVVHSITSKKHKKTLLHKRQLISCSMTERFSKSHGSSSAKYQFSSKKHCLSLKGRHLLH